MSAFKELRLFLVLSLAFILLWVVLGSETRQEETDPRLSSYNATYPGCKAWYLLLEEVGVNTRRLTGSFPDTLRNTGVFVLANPSQPILDDELTTMLDWVRAGGHFLLIGDDFTNPLSKEFQGGVELTRERTKASHEGKVPAVGTSPFASYVGPLYAGRQRYTRIPDGATRLHADKYGTLLVTFRLGKGRITALADPGPMTNQFIDKEGNARLGVWLAREEPVVFDEYHHGYSSEPGIWQRMGPPLRLACLQLLLAALLMAWTYSRRFGAVRLPPFTDRRSAGEYVVSLGALLQRSKGDRTALNVIGRAFRHDLAAWLGAPSDLSDEELVRSTLDRASVPRDRLERALAATHGNPPPGLNPTQACRLIASVREELHLHVRPATAARHPALPGSA